MTLLARLASLYLFAALGFVAGRKLAVRKESIAPLLIYMLTPLVVFRGAITADTRALRLPLLVIALSCAACLAAHAVARRWFTPPSAGILGFAAGNSNSGYFGLPAATAVLGEAAFAQAVLISFGFVLFENTLGFYVAARGRFTARQSLCKLLRLPTLYAFILGLGLHAAGVGVSDNVESVLTTVRGAYGVLGMMLLGLAVADLPHVRFDLRFTGFALVCKFLMYPALAALAIACVPLTPLEQRGLMLAAILPMAANTVAYATLFGSEPEQVSLSVVASTLLSPLLIVAFF